MNQKIIVVPIDDSGSHAKLLFNKINDKWVCSMDDSFMNELQDFLNGVDPNTQIKPWGKLPWEDNYGPSTNT
jgi:hypothetical protein